MPTFYARCNLAALAGWPLVFSGFLVLFGLPANHATAQSQAEAEEESRLWQAVERLRDDRFQVRQAAMEELWRAGEAARPMLKKAAAGADREAASRATSLLRRFDLGLLPDTDPEIARWINTFRFGSVNEKRAVLEFFREKGMTSQLIRLVSSENNPAIRDVLARSIANEIQEYAKRLPATGADGEWDRLLRFGATNKEGMRHYAAFLAIRDRHVQAIAELTEEWRRTNAPETAKLLVFIHRASGNWDEAIKTAQAANESELLRDLAYESRRWDLVAQLIRERTVGGPLLSQDIEGLGLLAVANRLQGDSEAFTQTMDAINGWDASRKSYLFYVGEALMINGYYADGVARVVEHREEYGFRLFVRRGQFKRAFELVGIADETGFSKEQRDAWYQAQTELAFANRSDRDQVFSKINYVTRALHSIGLREEAEERVATLAARAMNDRARVSRMVELADTAVRYFGREQAQKYAAEAVLGGRAEAAMGVLFPSDTQHAVLAMHFLEQTQPDTSKLDRLKELDRILTPRGGQNMSEADMTAFMTQWLQVGENQSEAKQATRGLTLAVIAERHEHVNLAINMLQEHFVATSVEAAMRAAELCLKQKRYEDAETFLNEALEHSPNDPPALYLRGWTRKQRGDVRGEEDIQSAILRPLAVSSERRRLAQALQRSGLKDEAVAEYRRILRLGDFHEWNVNDAAKQIGNTISGENLQEASEHWERLLFSGLKRSSWFTAVEGYLQLKHLIHKTRGRALLNAGRPFEASREFETAFDAIPEDISLAEDAVPEMDAKGWKQEADLLFGRVYRANLQIVEDYPESAMHQNNLAWLSARCNRRLEEALTRAQKANELRPDTASYIDTLGEVFFRLGRKDEAIDCAKRCLDLDPDNQFYREQLERFEGRAKPEDQRDDSPS